MRFLPVSRPAMLTVLALLIAQLACGLGSAAPTSPAPSVAPPGSTEPAATSSSERATPAEAQAMLQLAVQHYQSVGREQALADFSVRKAPFIDRDLYIICLGTDHKVTANGGFPLLVGTSADSLKDAKGQPIGQVVWDAAAAQPEGALTYHWVNPLTGQDESKILFYQTLEDDVCGVAADNP